MTTPTQTDPALTVVNIVHQALADCFATDVEPPPRGGGSDNVRFFAGDTPAMSAWDSHSSGGNACDEPFLWLRVMRRYRSKSFPTPTVATDCKLTRVIAVEIGVARCAVTDQHPEWEAYAEEALVSLDDSWRIEKALCVAMARLKGGDEDAAPLIGTDTIVPYGPEGGVLSWSGVLYASY